MKFKQVKQIARYNTSRPARKKDNTTILDGLHLIEEAFVHAPESIQNVFFTEKAQRENPEIAAFLMKIPHIPHERVSGEIMHKISLTDTPPGIVATLTPPLPEKKIDDSVQCIVVLDKISDPGNVGTIIRSAVSIGADLILLTPGCADVWSPKVLRAAQGAHFSMPIYPNYDLTLLPTRFDGQILGAFLDDTAQSIYTTDLTGRIAICVGNEGAGIDPTHFSEYGTGKIYIPMQKGFESLNVGVATSIILAERQRQILQ